MKKEESKISMIWLKGSIHPFMTTKKVYIGFTFHSEGGKLIVNEKFCDDEFGAKFVEKSVEKDA